MIGMTLVGGVAVSGMTHDDRSNSLIESELAKHHVSRASSVRAFGHSGRVIPRPSQLAPRKQDANRNGDDSRQQSERRLRLPDFLRLSEVRASGLLDRVAHWIRPIQRSVDLNANSATNPNESDEARHHCDK